MKNSSDPRTTTASLIRHTFFIAMAWLTPGTPVAAYLIALALGLSTEDAIWALTRVLPPVLVGVSVLLTLPGITLLLRRDFPSRPDEPPQARLIRLQKLPWKLAAMSTQFPYFVGGIAFTFPLILRSSQSPLRVGLGMLIGITFGLVLSIPVGIKLEQLLMPHVLEARKGQREPPRGRGFFWPRQSWYLPYVFAACLTTSLLVTGLVLTLQTMDLRDAHMRDILADPSIPPAQAELVATKLRTFSDTLLSSMGKHLLALGAFILLVPSLTAWMLARRQARAAAAVQASLEALAHGTPFAPRWASTDEIGDLSAGMIAVLGRIEEIPTLLQASARRLLESSSALSSAIHQQRQNLAEQASALQEAHVTSEEIRATSMLASRRADSVLSETAHAEQLGLSGEAALERTLEGLNTIRQFVDGIQEKVLRLQESAAQIAGITLTVKDLADQSNLLALNASIEAARSGEHGTGFAVIAREVRKLADQSILETARIRKSLQDIIRAIRDVANMSEQGAQQVEGGLELAKSSGDNLREMSIIIRENAAAVRQIASAVNQQNAGITQIFTAIAQVSTGMDETVERLDTTRLATLTLQSVIQEVTAIARRYQARESAPDKES
jgi:methyl-accepting chemotaxis protein